jgi:hypothetical protein
MCRYHRVCEYGFEVSVSMLICMFIDLRTEHPTLVDTFCRGRQRYRRALLAGRIQRGRGIDAAEWVDALLRPPRSPEETHLTPGWNDVH